jgi:hypothetical protein
MLKAVKNVEQSLQRPLAKMSNSNASSEKRHFEHIAIFWHYSEHLQIITAVRISSLFVLTIFIAIPRTI